MDDLVLEQIAKYFRSLGEPLRLKILQIVREEPTNVGQITKALGCSQANASKHLGILTEAGLLEREQRGTSVYYRFADPRVYQLCDLVCGQLARKLAGSSQLLGVLTELADRQSLPTATGED
jgi:DNA-binding transcriptional ArsR family regulator